MYRKLFLTLTSDTHIITATRRLAIHLQNAHMHHQGNIECLENWIQKLWSQQTSSFRVLSETEEYYLWQRVVSQSLDEFPLLQVSSTAQLVQQAWRRLKLWQRKFHELDLSNHYEAQQFAAWCEKFQLICRENAYLPELEVPLKLLETKKQNILVPAKQLLLIGFDEIPPLYHYFFEQLGIPYTEYFPDSKANQVFRLSLADVDEEIYLMARWAKSYLTHKPSASIACIIPELSHLRDKIQTIFNEVMNGQEDIFNISLGPYLSERGFIQSAIDLLHLEETYNEASLISKILNSPFLNRSLENNLLAADTDLALRENNYKSFINLNRVKSVLAELKNEYSNSDLSERWQSWQDQFALRPSLALPKEWVELFKKELDCFGWSQQDNLAQEEIELLGQWNELLETFANFDTISGPVPQKEALKIIQYLSQTRRYQPIKNTARLQILGLLETSGLNFEAQWIMGLNDRVWPQAAQPNPFIPYYQQRAWDMPHASSDREMNYCLRLQERLINCAATSILSCALEDKHLTQGPSALIKAFTKLDKEELIERFQIENYVSKAQQLFHSLSLEYIRDNEAPALESNEKLQGGSFILKEQAICPFRAFAKIRLNAFSLPERELGIDALTKGILVHKTLEIFWKKIKTQDQLKKLTEAELEEYLQKCIHQALKRYSEPAEFLAIEKERLLKLLTEWLKFEKERSWFKVIAEEANMQIKVGKLILNLRIDRIDELEDGSYLIIDYKTGLTPISNWFKERITEPQLPLYAAYAFTQANAIALAQLQSGQMKLKGISADEKSQNGLIPLHQLRYEIKVQNWQELVKTWKEQLEKTALGFSQGKAEVDPYDPSIACSQCNLQSLCRINEEKNPEIL